MTAAREIMVSAGVGAVTVEAVVQTSGVARSTIYRHFPTRGAIVAATLQQLAPSVSEPAPGTPTRDALVRVLEDLVTDLGDGRWSAVFPSLLVAASRDPEMRQIRDHFTERQTAPLRTVLGRAVEAGEVAPDQVDRVVALLAGPPLVTRLLDLGPLAPDLPAWLVDRALARPDRER
jgi:AcrR family transcriptional regulator